MDTGRMNVFRKWMTVAGSFLLCSVGGFLWYYGNLYIYVVSFILRYQEPSPYVLSQWTVSIYMISLSFAYLVSGIALDYTSKRVVLLAGILFSDCGMICSYFTIRVSMTALNTTIGFFQGFGNGLVSSIVLQYTSEWSGTDVGVMMAAVQSGLSVGGIVWNQFLTAYINPDHERAESVVKGFKFFSQDNVVDNVPSALLTFGCAKLAVSLAGFAMLREPPQAEHKADGHSTTTYDSNGVAGDRGRPGVTLGDDVTTYDSNGVAGDRGRPGVTIGDDVTTPGERAEGVGSRGDDVLQVSENLETDHTPWKMLKIKEYYLILFSFLASTTLKFITANYYKVYGVLYIQDDYFLTFIGTMAGLVISVSKIMLGYCLDRFGVKNCLVAILTISALTLSFYFFTPMQSKWLYLVFTLVIYTSTSLYSFYGGVLVKLFGKTHFAKNFSSLMLASCVLLLALPRALEEIIIHIGWFALFCLPALLCTVAITLVVGIFPIRKKLITS